MEGQKGLKHNPESGTTELHSAITESEMASYNNESTNLIVIIRRLLARGTSWALLISMVRRRHLL
jgi:hypothetical protein